EHQPWQPCACDLATAVTVLTTSGALLTFLLSIESPNRLRVPDLKERDQAQHRDDGRTNVGQPGPVKVRNQELGDGEGNAGHRNRRPNLFHPFVPGVRPHQPEGHQYREEWQNAANL